MWKWHRDGLIFWCSRRARSCLAAGTQSCSPQSRWTRLCSQTFSTRSSRSTSTRVLPTCSPSRNRIRESFDFATSISNARHPKNTPSPSRSEHSDRDRDAARSTPIRSSSFTRCRTRSRPSSLLSYPFLISTFLVIICFCFCFHIYR